jgi:hypothetical protein
VTKDRALKKAARARMVASGEKYTEARRAMQGKDDRHETPRAAIGEVDAPLRPGSVTAFVCGGGMTNLGAAMPSLVRLIEAGHPLSMVIGARQGLLGLPSEIDFAIARKLATVDEVVELIVSEDAAALERLVGHAIPNILTVDAPMLTSSWRELLAGVGATERAAVLWVQDIQVGAPMAGGSGNEVDQIPWQIDCLRELARETGAIVALGHCMPDQIREGWSEVAEGADETFVITDKVTSDTDLSKPRVATLLHIRDSIERTFSATIDTSWGEWRREVWSRTR